MEGESTRALEYFDFPRTPTMRERDQRTYVVVSSVGNPFGCGGIFLAYVANNSREIGGSFGRPTNSHQELRMRSIWRRTSSCETNLPSSREERPFFTSRLNHSS